MVKMVLSWFVFVVRLLLWLWKVVVLIINILVLEFLS